MPGKQPRDGGATALTREMSKMAGDIMKVNFEPSKGQGQLSDDEKKALVSRINRAFQESGMAPIYSQRKLEDWVGNCCYRYKCSLKRTKPECWGVDGRRRARQVRKNRKRSISSFSSSSSLDGSISKRGPSSSSFSSASSSCSCSSSSMLQHNPKALPRASSQKSMLQAIRGASSNHGLASGMAPSMREIIAREELPGASCPVSARVRKAEVLDAIRRTRAVPDVFGGDTLCCRVAEAELPEFNSSSTIAQRVAKAETLDVISRTGTASSGDQSILHRVARAEEAWGGSWSGAWGGSASPTPDMLHDAEIDMSQYLESSKAAAQPSAFMDAAAMQPPKPAQMLDRRSAMLFEMQLKSACMQRAPSTLEPDCGGAAAAAAAGAEARSADGTPLHGTPAQPPGAGRLSLSRLASPWQQIKAEVKAEPIYDDDDAPCYSLMAEHSMDVASEGGCDTPPTQRQCQLVTGTAEQLQLSGFRYGAMAPAEEGALGHVYEHVAVAASCAEQGGGEGAQPFIKAEPFDSHSPPFASPREPLALADMEQTTSMEALDLTLGSLPSCFDVQSAMWEMELGGEAAQHSGGGGGGMDEDAEAQGLQEAATELAGCFSRDTVEWPRFEADGAGPGRCSWALSPSVGAAVGVMTL